MIEALLSEKVLTIGNQSENPDGGISYVLFCYRKFVFPTFKSIVNFKRGYFAHKLAIALWAYLCEFLILMFDRSIRIVHVHTASGIAFKRSSFYISLAHAFRKKVIIHIHSGRFNEYWIDNRNYVEKVLSKCDCVIALSEDLKAFYEAQGCNKVTVINNIIVPPIRMECHKDDDMVHVLFLGVITRNKGIYDLIEVINEHKEEFKGKLFLHVGGNSEVGTLTKMIEEKDLHELVNYEGWLSDDAKSTALNLCDVFILPSYTEGVPISILEALSYGKFVLATQVGGIPGVIDEKCGLLIPPQDKISLYNSLHKIVHEKVYRNDVSYRIMKSESYLPDAVSIQLQSLYERLIS